MLEAMLVIFGCQLIGEAIARGISLPIPGPVIGMLLLFIGLRWHHRSATHHPSPLAASIGLVATFLLAHLSLLFVPAGTGIVAHMPTVMAHGPGLIVALVVSTVLSLLVTALVFVGAARWFDGTEQPDEDAV